METIVELRTRGRGSSQQAWLEVSFAGLHPPVQLFDDLSMVGWTTPPIPPPPASAIDWTTPDPGTGQSFTLKDYLVEHLVIDPPKGTGPLGRWTDADRKIHLQVVERVLHRHGLELHDGAPPSQLPPPPAAEPANAATSTPSAAPAPAAAAAPTTIQAAPASESATLPARAASAAPAPAVDSAPPVTASDGPAAAGATLLPNGVDRVVAAVPPSTEATLATAMANLGVRGLTFERVHRTRTYKYRGSTTEEVVLDHLRLAVLVPSSASEEAAATIRSAVASLGMPAPDVAIEHVEGGNGANGGNGGAGSAVA